MIADGLRHDLEQYWKLVRNLPAMAKALARSSDGGARGTARRHPGLGPQTPLIVAIDGERGFATASIPLAAVREIAADHDAHVNDVVLAVCAGALRRYLGRHGGVPEQPLVACMPVSLRGPGKVELTTQATMARIDLATDIAHPFRRLQALRDATSAAKAAVTNFASGLRHRLYGKGVRVVTILPGFVDTPMTAAFPKGPLWASPDRVAGDTDAHGHFVGKLSRLMRLASGATALASVAWRKSTRW